MKIKTHKVIDTEWGNFCVSVTWVDTHCASATPDHGHERWTSYTPLDVEITDDDGKTISFFCPKADKLTSELDIYVAGLIESEELTVND